MIVVLDRHNAVRARPALATPSRSVVLGLAPAPSRSIESAWPRWLVTYDHASKSVARSSHRRSRRSD